MKFQLKTCLIFCLIAFALLFPNYSQAVEEKKAAPSQAAMEIAKAEAFSLDKDAIKEWIKGPVRYIARFEDEATYKQFKTDEERIDFIYEFWLKRDPTPWTLKNEFREQFWDRVATVNALYAATTKPGWMTDRGKIHILFGPPNDIEIIPNVLGAGSILGQSSGSSDPSGRHRHPLRDASESGHRGMERWIFSGREEFTNPYVVVAFYKDESGDYILSENPLHYTKKASSLEYSDPYIFSLIPKMAEGPQIITDEEDTIKVSILYHQMTQAKFDIAQAINVTSGEVALKEVIKTLDYYEPLKSRPEFNYFPAKDNRNYVLLSVDFHLKDFYESDIPESGIVPIAMFGRAISRDDGSEYVFSSDDFAPRHIVREGNKASIMASFSVPPGNYTIAAGLQEMVSGRIVSFQKEMNVPDLENCALGISNYMLAKSIAEEKIAEAKAKPNPLPFGMTVVPKVDNEFRRSEDFAIYYQVCGLGSEKETGKNDYDLSYQFYRKEKGKLVKLGKPVVFPDRHEAEEGWSFPLSKWPSGEYTLEIEIYDKINNQKALTPIDFRVLD